MRVPLLAILALTLTLGACTQVRESRFNPLNWFGRSESRAVAEANRVSPRADPRPMVDQVTAMAVEQLPGGAILRATGLPPTQGHWDAELVQVDVIEEVRASDGTVTRMIDDTVLLFDFRLIPPPYVARASSEYSREVEAATYLTTNDLENVSLIIVRGQRTERLVRR